MSKCEIFDRSDFNDFNTIKSVWEGDFGVKVNSFFIFRDSYGAVKFLTHMLRLILKRSNLAGRGKNRKTVTIGFSLG